MSQEGQSTQTSAAVSTSAQDRAELLHLVYGYRDSAMLHVIDTLGVADRLTDGPRSSAEIAAAVGAHEPTLLRLLRGAATVGLLAEIEPARFALTPRGSLLCSDTPASLRGTASFAADSRALRTWGDLLHTARTGEMTFEHVWGMNGFEYFAQNPEISVAFNEAMARGTRLSAPALLEAYDFSTFETIVDVGGGNGTLLAAILAQVPGAHGVVQDSASGAEGAPAILAAAGVADRTRVDHRDFFQSVTPSGDCYVLKHVLHDWNDDQCHTILCHSRAVIPDHGRLVVVESVLPETVDTSPESRMVVMADLNMLVNTDGRERTEQEYRHLVAAAGFEVREVIQVEAPWPLAVIEAAPSHEE